MPGEYIADAKKVEQMIKEKQAIEVMLAWDLLETFNKTPELIQTLRLAAGKALNEIVGALNYNQPDWLKVFFAIKAAVEDEKKASMKLLNEKIHLGDSKGGKKPVIDVVTAIKPMDGLAKLITQVDKFDAQECSDTIRLYGTFVEKMVEAAGPQLKAYQDLLKKKMAERTGAGGEGLGAEKDAVWNTAQNKDGSYKAAAGRHRWRFEAKGPVSAYQKAIEDAGPGSVHEFLVSMKGGQALFGLADSSTIGKIDRTFGLVPAADISGTTADTIFFMKKFVHNQAHTIDPIFDLLPLATIVAGAHHSLLEVALPLSTNKIVDYHVGYYSTLMPKRDGLPNHKGVTEIKAALDAAEKMNNKKLGNETFTNHHMFVTYDAPKKVSGAYVFKENDAAFKTFAKGTALLKSFQAGVPWPKKEEAEKILKAAKCL